MKRRSATHRVLLAAAAAVMAANVRAQAPPEERIPVRDPDTLAAMGFRKDAKNVFVWSGADTGRKPGDGAVDVPESWGALAGSTNVMGYLLKPMRNVGYARYRSSIGATYCEAGANGSEGGAPLDLPDGSALKYLQFWAYDTDAAGDVTFDLYEDCQAPGTGGEPTITLIAGGATSGTGGRFYDFRYLNGYTVNNSHCHYSIRVLFGSVGVACVGSPLQVQKVRVAWTRQVSPAPGIATFNDVPTGHPFFQFVEALAKSGITGGCGGGAYCVDQPLTRGQMAVFLAKGLGLEWP